MTIQRHLGGVEFETILLRDIKHIEVNARIFVAGETGVNTESKGFFSGLPLLLRQRLIAAIAAKIRFGIFEAEDFHGAAPVDASQSEALE